MGSLGALLAGQAVSRNARGLLAAQTQLSALAWGQSWPSALSSSSCCCQSVRHHAKVAKQQRTFLSLQTELQRKDYKSLYCARPSPIPPNIEGSFLWSIARKVLLYDNKRNQLIIGGQTLYDAIQEQVDDGMLQQGFDMDGKIFYSTYTLLAIHVWLVLHRLQGLTTNDDRFFKQRFYNHFQHDVERRIYQAGVQIGVTKWLTKLESVFYSSGLSFDRVLRNEAGDETIELVVLREFFGNDLSKRQQAALIAQYITHELQCLQLTEDQHILKGHIQFSSRPFAAALGTSSQREWRP